MLTSSADFSQVDSTVIHMSRRLKSAGITVHACVYEKNMSMIIE